MPILAELHRGEAVSGWAGGAKFITLCRRLDANEVSVRQSLDHLIELGHVRRNAGHGHPLRPEYVLTARGERLAPACESIDTALVRLHLRPLGLRRWSLPALYLVDRLEPARFKQISAGLGKITDRALSLSLKGLCGGGLVDRRVEDEFPVTTAYRVGQAGAGVAPLLAGLG